jgi:hypothetical protein
MPVVRYFIGVGSLLLAALFLAGENGSPSQPRSATESWTASDTLRSMAHHGEPTAIARWRTVGLEQTE